MGVVVGVSLLFFLVAVVDSYFGGLVPLIFNVALVVFLYTRPSARATVVASATGPGLAYIAFYLYRVIGPFEGPVGVERRRRWPRSLDARRMTLGRNHHRPNATRALQESLAAMSSAQPSPGS